MSLAYDGAEPFSLTSAKAHGGVLCTGYIIGHPGGLEPITRARVNQIRAAGMGFLPNWERAADWARTASTADAWNAGREALNACLALGIPTGKAVAFSFDYQIPSWDYARCAGLLATCQKAMGGRYSAIAYGQSGFLTYLAAHGQPGSHWLMMSTFGLPEYDVTARHVGLVQAHDAQGNWLTTQVGGTDVNTLIHPETLSAWWPDNSPFGDDVSAQDVITALNSPAGQAAIRKAIWAAPIKTTDPDGNKPITVTTGEYLVSMWYHAKQANETINNARSGVVVRLAQVQQSLAAVGKSGAAVDAAAVAADVTGRVRTQLAAYFGGTK